MNKFLMCSMLIISSAFSNASNIGWLDFSNVSETRKHFKEETLTILHACKNKESYRKIKNFGAIEYIVKACSVSKKFPIASDEKKICDFIAEESLERMKLICSKNSVEKKYSEEDLAPYFNKFLNQAPKCFDQYSCFEQFIQEFSLEHAEEFDCSSKFRLSYDLMCKLENPERT
ncbi:TPA: hypothetical protein JBD70_15240 [Legionella pneumophila subsp. pneumophila]|uniref:DUF19 domain-containing protein n=1 Tax=Legionella taurinensis TaxID=70611 RepID=A0A3A5L8K7_9GAMM|nr:hypothetical protein [Legionella taurinensis]RJT44441.1 hypothetical protein D6J04_12495 [Legionella taurinensis]HAT9712909.1 hypothetical protein [Legionella pneumophila subsp. pneumophila]HAT9921383.1 hypothetical protein [Legionella pneumophila subsp. pneumophila]